MLRLIDELSVMIFLEIWIKKIMILIKSRRNIKVITLGYTSVENDDNEVGSGTILFQTAVF
jgi:hypothetical protein